MIEERLLKSQGSRQVRRAVPCRDDTSVSPRCELSYGPRYPTPAALELQGDGACTDTGMTTAASDDENERFVVFAEDWLDAQFQWAANQKKLHPDDGPWRRGSGSAEERLMDALHYLQHALVMYDRCRDDLSALRAEVVELLRGIPGASERIERARSELARGEGNPLSDLEEPKAD